MPPFCRRAARKRPDALRHRSETRINQLIIALWLTIGFWLVGRSCYLILSQ
jgi:hypothetical protein